jgi:hypothetical protein
VTEWSRPFGEFSQVEGKNDPATIYSPTALETVGRPADAGLVFRFAKNTTALEVLSRLWREDVTQSLALDRRE